VGEDGPTHHGIFDISYLRTIPNLSILAPSSTSELGDMLEFALKLNKPVAIRYPKGSSHHPPSTIHHPPSTIQQGKFELLKKGSDIAIIALGSMVGVSLEVAGELEKHKISTGVVNARFAKPLDEDLIEELALKVKKIVTLEEGVISGGFGSAVAEFIEREKIDGAELEIVGLPDEFVEHGPREILLNKYNMSKEGLVNLIQGELL